MYMDFYRIGIIKRSSYNIMSHVYYGQFNPPVDKIIHQRYFPNKQSGISIECGAFDGVTDSCTKFFEDNYNWKTINIEALDIAFNKLVINRPSSTNINIALSDTAEIKEFKNYRHPQLNYEWGNGSIHHTPEHKKYLENLCGDNYEVKRVSCNTYKHIIDTLKITQLDLFVLDVEGHELDVINGMIGCDVLPDVFAIEHGHRDTNIFVEKLKCLNKTYKLDYVCFNNSYFVKS